MAQRYELLVAESTADEFHARAVPDPARPEVWWHRITAPAVVLGSTQPDGLVDRAACAAAGVDVVRRRSGGGAVLLAPGEVTWIDVIVPAGGAGWADDVHVPMRWFGRHLAAVFGELGIVGAAAHEGAMEDAPWSRLVCFAGLGPGEVVVDGRKLAGISQRRTRGWARLQCCWYSRHDHRELIDLLAVPDPPRSPPPPVAVVAAEIGSEVPSRLVARLGGAGP